MGRRPGRNFNKAHDEDCTLWRVIPASRAMRKELFAASDGFRKSFSPTNRLQEDRFFVRETGTLPNERFGPGSFLGVKVVCPN